MAGVWRVISRCIFYSFENRMLAVCQYSRRFSIEGDTHSIDGHIQSIQSRQGSIAFLRRGSDRFNRMGPPALLDLPSRAPFSSSILDLHPRSPVFRLGHPTTPRFGKLFNLVGSRCGPRRIQNSGRFEIICHIPTENVVREEQGSSRFERTSNRTEARRGDDAKACKSRPESLESASKLNKNLIGMNYNLGR
jgi:hypothetical protein